MPLPLALEMEVLVDLNGTYDREAVDNSAT